MTGPEMHVVRGLDEVVQEHSDKTTVEYHIVTVDLHDDARTKVEVLVSNYGYAIRCWHCAPFCAHERTVQAWVMDRKERGVPLPWAKAPYDQDMVTP